MIYTKPLSKLSNKDVNIAGGKGASLGELLQIGVSVPGGFVVLADAFDSFLDEANLRQEIQTQFDKVDKNEIHTVEQASKQIQESILHTEMPKDVAETIMKDFLSLGTEYVAVRSSATVEDSGFATWAGQLDTYLNTTKATLLENIKRSWASLFTPRAIFYRYEKKLEKGNVSVAVVVQEMVESEKAGVAFSVHPVTHDRDQIIIEAGFGLGEAVVSGLITPDLYIVSKKDNKIIDINVYEQKRALYKKNGGGNEWRDVDDKNISAQVLNEKDILKLADIVKKIENHYETPQDIEWAFVNGKFYITQSRPVTTLQNVKLEEGKKLKKDYELHFTVSGFSILSLDMIFNSKSYGAVDYVVLYENDITRAYLTKKGIKQCYDISTSLLDDDFVCDLFTKSKKLDEELKSYKLGRLDEKNVIEEWEKVVYLNDKFCELYRFYEQPFQQALEQEILKLISKEELIEILAHNSFDKLQNAKAKKYIDRLLKMGKIKLKLHKDSENVFANNFFSEYVSKKYNLSVEKVSAMRADEFERALYGKLVVTANLLEERLKGAVFVKERGEWNLYTGKRYEYWKNKVQKISNKKIVGDVAFPGIARGYVVTHFSWTDVTEIQKGDVLVTGMTNPQMIPFIRKASAIVTDEGGITCHAAIISRELKKPCIVGTKNATQVLKDGDLVEVNAIEGFVRIIEKSKK